jgi:lipopolysaccharide/colanic/teichoic acid biosynthesis glycosyltransferase
MNHPTTIAGTFTPFRRDSVVVPTRECSLPMRHPASLRRTEIAKRAIDMSIAIVLFPIVVPMVLLCAAIVKITSRGPAFYSQERVGRFGKVFTIYKLRSMFHHCERKSGPQWSKPGDPRVTPFGRFLRASHIDELPQLINVIRGQMSLVGPRPERPEIAAKLANEVRGYDDRSSVPPGISGNAQIHLPPDVTIADVREKLLLDKEYIQRYSAKCDLLTLWRTFLKVIGLYRTRA